MAYAPAAATPREVSYSEVSTTKRRGLLLRLFDAMMLSRQRQAEREIARYLKNIGKFTDDAEREIERLFLSIPHR